MNTLKKHLTNAKKYGIIIYRTVERGLVLWVTT